MISLIASETTKNMLQTDLTFFLMCLDDYEELINDAFIKMRSICWSKVINICEYIRTASECSLLLQQYRLNSEL